MAGGTGGRGRPRGSTTAAKNTEAKANGTSSGPAITQAEGEAVLNQMNADNMGDLLEGVGLPAFTLDFGQQPQVTEQALTLAAASAGKQPKDPTHSVQPVKFDQDKLLASIGGLIDSAFGSVVEKVEKTLEEFFPAGEEGEEEGSSGPDPLEAKIDAMGAKLDALVNAFPQLVQAFTQLRQVNVDFLEQCSAGKVVTPHTAQQTTAPTEIHPSVQGSPVQPAQQVADTVAKPQAVQKIEARPGMDTQLFAVRGSLKNPTSVLKLSEHLAGQTNGQLTAAEVETFYRFHNLVDAQGNVHPHKA